MLKGKVIYINATKNSSKKENQEFLTRTFGLDTSVMVNGVRYENYVSMQLTRDNCKKLDFVGVGDEVEVDFSIRGSLQKNHDKTEASVQNPESIAVFTNIEAYEIRIISKATPVADSTPAPTPAKEEKPPF